MVADARTFLRLQGHFAEQLVHKSAAAPFWTEALIVGETDQAERTWGSQRRARGNTGDTREGRRRRGEGGVDDCLSGCLERETGS